ncbi:MULTISPECIES: ABC transporter permease [Halomonas]|uniref:Inner membrane ABC transporter permease protein YdcV n=1 Tax=Halomonas chromatireducens TaxID=507626 RepID=A0A0X8HBN2_9GAMM|nr:MULTISPECIES: ABC transporter permease [Halomonas]AMC99683.1 Inner membrane ABC transporter permease protein YdcV [Halomonas chromatireducens]MBZ0332059.1 ABC transporter permease [Halomonas sp. ANAO-440]
MALPPYASPIEKVWFWVFRGFCGLVLLFLITPVLVIIPLSFSSSSFLTYPLPGFSLRWYAAIFDTSGPWMGALKNSLIVAPLATLLAMTFGTLAAVGLNRADFPGKGLIIALLISPMVVPLVIVAVGMYFFFAQVGLLNSYAGLVLAHTVLGVPFVVITVNATLQGFDFNQVRAGASLGANPLRVFFTIILPQIVPGVVSGGLFAFATSFDEVVVALFIASPTERTLPIQMFSGIRENISPAIAAMATILILMSTLLLVTMELLRRRSERLKGAI